LPKKIAISDLPLDAPERRRLPILLRRAWYGLNQAFRRRIAHLKITPDQFTALRTLTEADPKGIVQSELVKLMASDPNTIAALIERMEKSNLVERRTHETDRRANRIRVSDEGLRRYKQAREIAIALQSEVVSILPDPRREQFLADLSTISDACQAAVRTDKR
jgi:DNA-binding MarR family transcriptional regulator